MIQTCAVMIPLIYDKEDLPEGIDIEEQKMLIDTAFNTGWRVRFYKIFEYKNVLYERYIFEREVE